MQLKFKTAFILLLSFVLLGTRVSFAKKQAQVKKKAATVTAKKNTTAPNLNEIVKKYRNTNLVKMKVTKVVKSELLGKETLYKGQMFLSHGKFRWDNDVPEKTQLIFDGITIWNVQHPPKELPGPLQIAKAKVDKNTKKQILISTLLSTNGINENFKVKPANSEGVFELEPKGKDLGVTALKIKTNGKKDIVEINYKDDVGNQTSLKFDDVEFSKKTENKLFEYTPPKGAQVTHL